MCFVLKTLSLFFFGSGRGGGAGEAIVVGPILGVGFVESAFNIGTVDAGGFGMVEGDTMVTAAHEEAPLAVTRAASELASFECFCQDVLSIEELEVDALGLAIGSWGVDVRKEGDDHFSEVIELFDAVEDVLVHLSVLLFGGWRFVGREVACDLDRFGFMVDFFKGGVFGWVFPVLVVSVTPIGRVRWGDW
jgi:hypothetical protein